MVNRFAQPKFVKFYITKDNYVRTDEFAAIPFLAFTEEILNGKLHFFCSDIYFFQVYCTIKNKKELDVHQIQDVQKYLRLKRHVSNKTKTSDSNKDKS